MSEPHSVPLEAVLEMHSHQVREHGGIHGIRDHRRLQATLARRRNKFEYGEHEIANLAAPYAHGLPETTRSSTETSEQRS